MGPALGLWVGSLPSPASWAGEGARNTVFSGVQGATAREYRYGTLVLPTSRSAGCPYMGAMRGVPRGAIWVLYGPPWPGLAASRPEGSLIQGLYGAKTAVFNTKSAVLAAVSGQQMQM